MYESRVSAVRHCELAGEAGKSLDPFTLAVLRVHVEMLDAERKELGPGYHNDGWLLCWENSARRSRADGTRRRLTPRVTCVNGYRCPNRWSPPPRCLADVLTTQGGKAASGSW